jgi:hypothetical protein
MILLIPASQIARMKGMSHCAWLQFILAQTALFSGSLTVLGLHINV